MANFTYSVDDSQSVLTINVFGLKSEDAVFFYVRPSDGQLYNDSSQQYTATGATMKQTFAVLSPYKSWVCNVAVNGTLLGSQSFTTGKPTARPPAWSWSGIIWSGMPIEQLTAVKWEIFEGRIDGVRYWKGLPAWGFTKPESGMLLVKLLSETEGAISNMKGPVSVPSERTLSMNYFNTLAGALNNIT